MTEELVGLTRTLGVFALLIGIACFALHVGLAIFEHKARERAWTYAWVHTLMGGVLLFVARGLS